MLEHGFTAGGSAGSSYGLNSAVGAPYGNATVQGYEITLRSYLSIAAVTRSAQAGKDSKAAFVQESKAIVENMMESFVKRMEALMLYGQQGLGTIASEVGSTITITTAEWAPGIWAGATNMPIDVYTGSSFTQSFTVSSVDLVNRQITLSADTGNLSANDVIYYKGFYGNEMIGIHKIISSTSGTIFGIDVSTQELFRGTTVSAGSGNLTFAHIETGIARAMEKGLGEEDLTLLVHPLAWKNLLTEQDAKVRHSPMNADRVSIGSRQIVVQGPQGLVKIQSSIYVKEGYAYLLPLADFERLGSTDITFNAPGIGENFLRLMENTNAYEMRLYTDQSVFTTCISKCVLFNNIVN